MLKILFLRFHYRLSDRQVMERTKTDMAFRWFLDLGLHEAVPDHTNGTHFRQRIGVERFEAVFQELVGEARELGLVSDRLRLKDATHWFADVASPRPWVLAAQLRQRLLHAAQPLFADWVAEQGPRIEAMRLATAEQSEEERLGQRLALLRQMATELRQRLGDTPRSSSPPAKRERLERVLNVVDKLLDDQAHPQAGDRLASASDPDARLGKHGEFFLGYLLDLAMDADSELITAVNVLPGNGAEAADAVSLIQQEEQAQGNDVEELSLDGAGYNGPVLRELTDPAGLNLKVTVPPPQTPERKTFGPERFELRVLDDGAAEVTCPHGQNTRQRERTEKDTGYQYVFSAAQCGACPLRVQCLQHPASGNGRTVIKNDYDAEYQKVRAHAGTPEYTQTRRVHAKVERKLGEVTRHHQARRVCFRGQAKVQCQAFLIALVVNVKRMVKLLNPTTEATALRAALVTT
jgi:IS5 family transposase